ncbi:MAG: hypothetical protein LBE18_11610 [Planctomycetaceae bacterium]|nr:hypothetical protein [Planctomycetaceae bacterium]
MCLPLANQVRVNMKLRRILNDNMSINVPQTRRKKMSPEPLHLTGK